MAIAVAVFRWIVNICCSGEICRLTVWVILINQSAFKSETEDT